MCDYLDVNDNEDFCDESLKSSKCSNNQPDADNVFFESRCSNNNVTNIDDYSANSSRCSNNVVNIDDYSRDSSRCSNNVVNIDDESSCSNSYKSSKSSCDDISECSYQINENTYFLYNNNIIPVSPNQIYPLESTAQTIVMAALYNYSDDKDTSKFANIYLPEIIISYENLKKIFFTKYDNNFSPSIFNHFWKSIRGLSLSNIFLKTYENVYDLEIDNLPAMSKIKLYKECSFSNITLKAFKLVALNLEELNNELKNKSKKSSLYTSAVFHLFSEVLKVGIKITIRFCIKEFSNVCECHDNDKIIFDF